MCGPSIFFCQSTSFATMLTYVRNVEASVPELDTVKKSDLVRERWIWREEADDVIAEIFELKGLRIFPWERVEPAS